MAAAPDARERHLAGQALEEHAAQRVEVGPPVGRSPRMTSGAMYSAVPTSPPAVDSGRVVASVLGQPEVATDRRARARPRARPARSRLDVAVDEPCACAASSASASWPMSATARSGVQRALATQQRARSVPST